MAGRRADQTDSRDDGKEAQMTASRNALESRNDGTPSLAQRGRRTAIFGAGFAALVGSLLIAAPHGRDVRIEATAVSPAFEGFLAVGPSQASARAAPADREQRVLTEFLSRRFKVADEAVGTFVAAAFRAAGEQRVDPLLVLAVMAVESRFNPVAESSMGALGLMQVMPKFHRDKIAEHGGDAALLDPVRNIQIGTQILRDYLRRGGDLESGLQLYGGVADEPTSPYAGKVLTERSRLEQLLARQRRTGV